MNISIKNRKAYLSIVTIRSIAFIIFCGISVAISLNMFLSLAFSFFEKIVFFLASIGIEGAKIYYVTTAPLYSKAGRKGRARLQYVLYGVGAIIAIIASYGYITTTVMATDAIATAQSGAEEIANIEKDISLIDTQIQDISNKQKEERANVKNDAAIIDKQIKIQIDDIDKGKPDEVALNTWNWQISVKNKEIEAFKKQKTALLDKLDSFEKQSSMDLESFRTKRENLVTSKSEFAKKDASVLSDKKTDMFTNIGSSFGFNIPGKVVMAIVLILVALMIEIGIISTVPDPSLGVSGKGQEEPEESKSEDIVSLRSKTQSFFENLRKLAKKRPSVSVQEIKPIDPDPEPFAYTPIEPELPKKIVITNIDKNVEVAIKPKKPETTKTGATLFKPLIIKKKESVPEIVNQIRQKPPEQKPIEDIPTIVKKQSPAIKQNEESLKQEIISFLKQVYEGFHEETIPDKLMDIKKIINTVIIKKFFDRIANLYGDREKPLFTYNKELDMWTANYSLKYLMIDIVPKIRFNFYEEKKSKL